MRRRFVTPEAGRHDLEGLCVIKGWRMILTHDCIHPKGFRFFSMRRPARLSLLDEVNGLVERRLIRWGLTDCSWRDDVLTAITELLTNVCQSSPRGPRGGARGTMRLYCHLVRGQRSDYFIAVVIGDGNQQIPPRCARRRLRCHLGTRGRGFGIVRVLSDLFAILQGTDGVVIGKIVQRGAASRPSA